MVMTMRNTSASGVFTIGGFRRGFISALPFLISNGIAGSIMGIAYRGVGLSFGLAILFSALVYSATAQAVTLGLWAVPPPIAAMVLACVATNARYLVMGAHLRQMFSAVPKRLMAPTLFLLADASWLMTSAEAERGEPDAGFLLGASLPMAIGWIGGTGIGYALPLKTGGPLAIGAAFLPLAFIVSLLPAQWRGPKVLLPWAVAAGIGLLTCVTLGETWAMLVGGTAGTLVSMVRDA
jgi:predicted branched-subunit amino acid permease